MSGNALLIVIVWVVLFILVMIFIYNSGVNNKLYDNYENFNRCIEKQKPALLYFIGNNRENIEKNQYIIADIKLENGKVKVYYGQSIVEYNNIQEFFDEWTFIDEMPMKGDVV